MTSSVSRTGTIASSRAAPATLKDPCLILFEFSTGKEVLLDYDEFEAMRAAVEDVV